MYDKAFIVLIGTRVIKEIVMLPVQVITMLLLVQGLKKVTSKV